MQPNTITLSVDVLNTGVFTDALFTRTEDDVVNRSTYRGPDNSLSVKDTLQLYRSFPKRSGSFLGSAKTSIKTTVDVTVKSAEGLDVVYPLIAETTFSIPVGTPDAIVLASRQKHIAILDRDDLMVPLQKHLDV